MATARGMTGEEAGAFLEELSIVDGNIGTKIICVIAGPDSIELETRFKSAAEEVDFNCLLFGGNKRFERFKKFFRAH